MNWKHALGTVALAVVGVASYVFVFGDLAPGIPVLSWIAGLIRGGGGQSGG